MPQKLIGREEERQILLDALTSGSPEMVAVFGRRRVGKTFLIKETYKAHIAFEITGIQHATNAEQLENFCVQLAAFSKTKKAIEPPANWFGAFRLLAAFLEKKIPHGKRVVLLDELPWLAGHKSGFLTGLSWFWNSWAELHNVVVVICGSAASWMIQKVVNNRGGLHNRITKRVFLEPFTLKEMEAYLKSRNIFFDHYQMLQLYMAMGGIPHYLKEIQSGKSAIQNINDICFAKHGLLRNEFLNLYPALFAHADNHIKVVRALAGSRMGLPRPAIVKNGQLPEGGNTSKVLEELEQSGFINAYYPFGKRKKDMLYRLTDEYSLFYLRFIERNKSSGTNTWNTLGQSQAAKIWAGYAFENACFKHMPQLKKALGISGIYSEPSAFLNKGTETETGAQIDMLLDRSDHTICLFEIKFYNTTFKLTASDAESLRNQMFVFSRATGTKKRLMLVLVTTFGMEHNQHSLGLIEAVVTMDTLFE